MARLQLEAEEARLGALAASEVQRLLDAAMARHLMVEADARAEEAAVRVSVQRTALMFLKERWNCFGWWGHLIGFAIGRSID